MRMCHHQLLQFKTRGQKHVGIALRVVVLWQGHLTSTGMQQKNKGYEWDVAGNAQHTSNITGRAGVTL